MNDEDGYRERDREKERGGGKERENDERMRGSVNFMWSLDYMIMMMMFVKSFMHSDIWHQVFPTNTYNL